MIRPLFALCWSLSRLGLETRKKKTNPITGYTGLRVGVYGICRPIVLAKRSSCNMWCLNIYSLNEVWVFTENEEFSFFAFFSIFHFSRKIRVYKMKNQFSSSFDHLGLYFGNFLWFFKVSWPVYFYYINRHAAILLYSRQKSYFSKTMLFQAATISCCIAFVG